ncbi:hypothetical protein SCUCBS95973_004498 [Sporothrix curviconia]|uniref:Uncharacterized protein n=1 Tax=Sporothrix curviconia TaxID=1260050 RepID=A0ABP0BPQ4_9PEZI
MLASSFLSALALAGSGGLGGADTYPVEQLTAPAPLTHLGIRRARTTSGPFAVPAMVVNDTSDDNGMGSFQALAALPCRDCYITGFSFGVRYVAANGSVAADEANINTGMYLHHALLVNMNRTDTTCPPPLGVFQRMFGAGNERTYVDVSNNGTRRAGYYIGKEDVIALVAEIMNMQMGGGARNVVVTATWDYVAASSNKTAAPSAFASAIPVWLDIDGNCGSFTNGSEVAVPPSTSVFSYTMPVPWSPGAAAGATLDGNKTAAAPKKYEVLVAASHLHDGALQLDISKNGTLVCAGVASYGQTAAYISKVPGLGMPGMPGMSTGPTELTHISSIHVCSDAGTTSSNDHWSVTAHYNLKEHPGLETVNGQAKPIMGIGLLFLVEA